MKRFAVIALWVVLLAPSGTAHAIFDLSANRDRAGLVPVGLLGLVGEAGVTDGLAEVRRVLLADLSRSGLFDARDLGLNIAASPEESMGRIRIRQVGIEEAVEVLLWAHLSRSAGRLVLTGHMYDTARGRLVEGKRYMGPESQLRAMVHRFVGDLILRYTGEYGITRSRIAFVSDLSGNKEVFVMDYDGHAPKRLTSDRNIAVTPALSPDASILLYASQKSGGWNIYERNLATGQRSVVIDFPGLNVAPSWHPKGDGFAVTISKDGNQEIYHITRRGKMRRLTHHPGDDVSPSWSPDGRSIAFTSNRAGSPQIYTVGTRGGKPVRRTFRGRYNSEPNWSPRGKWIAYTCRLEGYFSICAVPAAGGESVQLTRGPWDDETPSFSPDGRHIAFSSTRGGKADIFMMRANGSDPTRLTYNGANNTSPAWGGILTP